jgi:hypothetical protein
MGLSLVSRLCMTRVDAPRVLGNRRRKKKMKLIVAKR